MALPARLTAVFDRHPDDLTEADLRRAVEEQVPEGADLDWKKDFYEGGDAAKKELAKDVSAMANTVGGVVVIGVDDGKKDHAHALAPIELPSTRGEEWMRSVLATWLQPIVPHVGIRFVQSAEQPGRVYVVITVQASPLAPHAVAQPGNDFHFRVHVRHGTTTRTLSESEIAQRYRDRFQTAADDVSRVGDIETEGIKRLGTFVSGLDAQRTEWYSTWVSLTAVPSVRGNLPLTNRAERDAAFQRFYALACGGITTVMCPDLPVLTGRRQVRFEGDPTGQLHQDGSFFAAVAVGTSPDRHAPTEPLLLHQRDLELSLVALVQAAAAWATETGAIGDLMLSAALHHSQGNNVPLRLSVIDEGFNRGPVSPVPTVPARLTADLAALATDKTEAVITAYGLVSDLLADMGASEPHVLTAEGDIRLARLTSEYRAELTGWNTDN